MQTPTSWRMTAVNSTIPLRKDFKKPFNSKDPHSDIKQNTFYAQRNLLCGSSPNPNTLSTKFNM